jgi:N-methylhydantoinase B
MSPEPRSVDFLPSRQFVIETPGAGGYGPPSAREPEMLARDYRGGRFSTAYLQEHYRFDPKMGDNLGKGKKP